MRRNILIIFSISILSLLILSSACVSQPPANQTTQQDTGLTQITEGSQYISFDVAHQNLLTYLPDSTNESAAIKTVYYIHGTNLDVSGNASSWIFGVGISNETELFAYQPGGWMKIPWNTPLHTEEIDVDKIVSPSRLFSQNHAVILSNPSPAIPERRDLDLIQGIYTLTITSDSTARILTFNATTGELISQP